MKEKIKNILSIIIFILLIIIVYFKDSVISFVEKFYNDTILEKGTYSLYVIIALCSFALVSFLIGYGIYSYLKNYSKKGGEL